MESRVGECSLAEKRGLCLESLAKARVAASRERIFDIDDTSVFLERKDMLRGNKPTVIGNIPPQVDRHYHATVSLAAP